MATFNTFQNVSQCTIDGGAAKTALYSTYFASNDGSWTPQNTGAGSITFGASGVTFDNTAALTRFSLEDISAPRLQRVDPAGDFDVVLHCDSCTANSNREGWGIGYLLNSTNLVRVGMWFTSSARYMTSGFKTGSSGHSVDISSGGVMTGYARLKKVGNTFSLFWKASAGDSWTQIGADYTYEYSGTKYLCVFSDTWNTENTQESRFASFDALDGIWFASGVCTTGTMDAGTAAAFDWSSFAANHDATSISYEVRESDDGATWGDWSSGIPASDSDKRYAEVRVTFGTDVDTQATLTSLTVDTYAVIPTPTIAGDSLTALLRPEHTVSSDTTNGSGVRWFRHRELGADDPSLYDESANHHTFSPVLNAAVQDRAGVYGGRGLYCPGAGAGSYAQAAYHSSLLLSTQDFCIEAFCYCDTERRNPMISNGFYEAGYNGGWTFRTDNYGQLCFIVTNETTTSWQMLCNHGLAEFGVHVHWCAIRTGGYIHMYVNGVWKTKTAIATDFSLGAVDAPFWIGRDGAGNMDGMVAGLRMTVGDARYTPETDFTVPDELTADSANVVLCLPFNGGPGWRRAYAAAGTNVTVSPNFDLSHGTWNLQAREIGSNGATSDTATYQFNADYQAPAAPNVSGDEITTDTTPTITWSAAGGGNGTFRYRIDSGDWTETTETSWTAPAPLTLAQHVFDVQERDAAGNWSSSGTLSFWVIADTPLAATCTDNADGTGATLTITGGEVTATNYVKVRAASGGDWLLETSRTGPGTGALALDAGAYVGSVTSIGAGLPASVVFEVAVTDGATELAPEEAIQSLLSNASAVTALTGARIYALQAPHGAADPCIIFQRITSTHAGHLRGASGWNTSRIQIDAYGDTYPNAKALSSAIRRTLDGYSGTVTVSTRSITITSCTVANENDGFEKPTDGSGVGSFRSILDFEVSHNELTSF